MECMLNKLAGGPVSYSRSTADELYVTLISLRTMKKNSKDLTQDPRDTAGSSVDLSIVHQFLIRSGLI